MKGRKGFTMGIGVVSILAFLGVVSLAVPTTLKAQETKTFKVGVLACMTGWFSGHDIKDANEAQVAADIINESGGITVKGQKYRIELIVEDGKSTLDGITAATNRLVYDKGVKFIIGPAAFFASAVAPVADPNQVIRVLGFSTNQPGELDKNTPYAFLGHDGTVGEVLACILYFNKHYPNVKKLAIVRPDDGAMPYLLPILTRALSDHGLSMVGDPILYPNENVDFNAIAAKLNAIKDADGILHVSGIVPQFGAVIKALRQLGNNKPYAAMTASSMNEISTIAGQEASKDVFTVAVTPGDPMNPPVMNEICKRITSKYGMKTSIYFQASNCLWVLKQAIEAAQSFDTKVVKAKWETMDKIDTLYGPGTMCGDETYGIKHHAVAHPMPIQILKDGKAASAGLMDIGIIP